MKIIPILFSTPMVVALINERKTMTRRIVKIQPTFNEFNIEPHDSRGFVQKKQVGVNPDKFEVIQQWLCPFGNIGDILWVRETYCFVSLEHAHDLLEGVKDRNQIIYKASVHDDWMKYAKEKYGYKWKPCIHMPKEACRLFVEITNIRIERLQEIGEQDAVKEGISNNVTKYYDYLREDFITESAYHSFFTLWESINGANSWENNPWVWVIEFKQVLKPVGF